MTQDNSMERNSIGESLNLVNKSVDSMRNSPLDAGDSIQHSQVPKGEPGVTASLANDSLGKSGGHTKGSVAASVRNSMKGGDSLSQQSQPMSINNRFL